MKILAFIIQKEFKQIFRNKGMLPIIFMMPIIQLIILSNAATFDIKNIKFSFIDHDKSPQSRALVDKFRASKYFEITNQFASNQLAQEAMHKGEVDVIFEIPSDFSSDLIKKNKTDVSVIINAINGATAAVENVYIEQIIQSYNREIRTSTHVYKTNQNIGQVILTVPSFWYNSTLNYKTFMVPGILVLLITMITLFLSGMNVVREKEIGTLEQINVTPIKKHHFIIGKLFPIWCIGFILLTIGLIIAKLIFNIPIVGSLPLMYGFTAVYMLLILGIGLFISNFSNTQQQAMFISWFFMVIFILMSGLFTPIESMPVWAQKFTDFNPIKYFVEVMRMVMLKGSSFEHILPQFGFTILYALGMNTLAVLTYKKTS